MLFLLSEGKKAFFLKKIRKKFCQLTKKHYLCIRNRERCSFKEDKTGGNSSVGRAQPCQGWGRGSESRFPLNMLNKKEHY